MQNTLWHLIPCTVIGLLLNVPSAWADCSAATISRMADHGKTVAAIGRACKMAPADVRDIIDAGASPSNGDDAGWPATSIDRESNGFLPRGTPVGQCGCWGPTLPHVRVPYAQCKSGSAEPRSCGVPCAAGGVAWQGVCS